MGREAGGKRGEKGGEGKQREERGLRGEGKERKEGGRKSVSFSNNLMSLLPRIQSKYILI